MASDKKETKKKKPRRSRSSGADSALKKQMAALALEDWLKEHYRDLYKAVDRKLQRQYSSGVLWIGQQANIGVRSKFELKDYVQSLADRNRIITQKYLNTLIFRHVSMRKYLITEMCRLNPELDALMTSDETGYVYRRADVIVEHLHIPERIIDELDLRYSLEYIGTLISKNSRYKEMVSEIQNELKLIERLQSNMLDSIPDNYVNLYPATRKMKRHFVLHIGPTNSGKTYHAMQAMKRSPGGIYLGPLRLLAFEQYESLNAAGYPCRLRTGEETLEVENALYQASTVEMMDPTRFYYTAVIDEAQMISDPFRGGAWTSAILGIQAEEVHVCAAAHAEKVLKTLISACGDTYEVMYHDRQVPLLPDRQRFQSLYSVREKDALIVFTKKDVHAVASELQRHGWKCSIVYGALPYDVRHEEARKFLEGETQVVVATDAIGMGLNLPAQRVVFLQTSKYDGKSVRYLHADEVQQIAGRAGRFGLYDTGWYNAFDGMRFIRSKMRLKVPDIREAVIGFPEQLISLEAPLSEILKKWNDIPVQEGFQKSDLKREIALCQELERSTDDKLLTYRFITIPFDEEDSRLRRLWRMFFQAELEGGRVTMDEIALEWPHENVTADDMPDLEEAFRVADLSFYYMDRFDHPEELPDVLRAKRDISAQITAILDSQSLQEKRCSNCGAPLPWNHRFGVCEDCFQAMYRGNGRRPGRRH